MNTLNILLFQVYPYIAIAVFLIGSWVRFDHAAYTWRSGSSQLLSDRGMRIGSNLFHVGMLAIIGGHTIGLLVPHHIYAPFISAPDKQLLAMIAGGIAGLFAFIGLSMLLHRRLFDPRIRVNSRRGDILVLLLLWLQLVLGLITVPLSGQHLDGSVMVLLAEWAQRIVTLRPVEPDMLIGVNWVFRAHILLGMTIFLVFPFTRLVHIWSVPVQYVSRQYQIVRQRG